MGESIITEEGEFDMDGFLPIKTEMHERFQALGYCIYRTVRSNVISKRGDVVVGHEFHYSRVIPTGKLEFAYRVKRGKGIDGKHDGIVKSRTLANYIHVHVLSYPTMIRRFLRYAYLTKGT